VSFPRVTVEPRGHPSIPTRILFPLAAIAGATAMGSVILLLSGHSPAAAFERILEGAFGTDIAWARTLNSSIPLILTGLAAAVAFRMKVWNIGGEGQFYLGAIAASGTALALGDDVPGLVAWTVPTLAGLVAGAAWAALAAFPRAYLRTDEVITTLMLNFVALHLMNYLIFGSVSFWRDREQLSFPSGRRIPEVAELPTIWLDRLHWGFVIAVATSVVMWWWLRSSRWGFGIRVIGDSPPAARYAGMGVSRYFVSVLLVSGAAAGLAGAIHMTGTQQSLEPTGLDVGYGYTGIVIAAVSRLNPLAIIPVSIFVAGLTNAGTSLQILDIPIDLVVLLQGLALLFVAAAEFFLVNRVRLVSEPPLGASA
jgi:ABC-type uncharacterized transport system permease subunit